MDTAFIAERQNGLQNYVNLILAHPVLARHISVKRFLDPVNYSCDFQGTAVHVLNQYVIREIHFQVYLVFNPGQNILGQVIKLGVRMNFGKLAHIVPFTMLAILVIQV